MASGNRNRNGKPTDIVCHFMADNSQKPFCNQKIWWYSTTKWDEVTCRKCLSCKNKSDSLPLDNIPAITPAFHSLKIII